MQEFKNRLINNKGYAENSVENYIRTITNFDSYLKKEFKSVEECEEITIRDIEYFIDLERYKGKSIQTCNNYLAGIRTFLRYCKIHGHNVVDHTLISNIRCRAKKIESLNDDDTTKLLDYFKHVKADSKMNELLKIRNLIIVNLFVYTGVRLDELSQLNLEDMQEHMQIIGKRGKRRYTHIHQDDLKLINYYKFLRKREHGPLLVAHSKGYEENRLSNVSIECIIRDGGRKAGIEEKVFPHKLRHTFATQLLKKKANIYHIQKLLGHSNLNTTQTYLSVLDTELEDTQNLIPRFC